MVMRHKVDFMINFEMAAPATFIGCTCSLTNTAPWCPPVGLGSCSMLVSHQELHCYSRFLEQPCKANPSFQ